MSELTKFQFIGIIIIVLASTFAFFNAHETLDTIAGALVAIGIALLILGKRKF